ncbi:S-adenosyl-L-methionine-dependent methyltransferase [Chytridium lagenaria]|nr:S-adenosyl-L-methionine-dependent methyltransferase [Chytridium lagenaria]
MSNNPNDVPRDKKADAWGDQADIYDSRLANMMSAHCRDALTLGGAFENASTSVSLLDVACGTGALTFEALRIPNCTVTATDFSAGMIETLKRKLKTNPIYSSTNIATHVEDGQTLACFPDESYDYVTSSFGIFLFPDRNAGWTSAKRVLKAGGTLIATSWKHDLGLMVLNNHLITKFRNKNQTLEKETFKAEVEANGFKHVKVFEINHELVASKGSHLMDVYMNNPAFHGIKSAVGEEKLERCIIDWFAAKMGSSGDKEEFMANPVQITTTSLVCIAKK